MNLSASLHALTNYTESTSFENAACSLVNRMMEAKNAADIRALGQGLKPIEPDLEDDDADNNIDNNVAELASRLVARMKTESDPEMLRPYGEVLGSLPGSFLSEPQFCKV